MFRLRNCIFAFLFCCHLILVVKNSITYNSPNPLVIFHTALCFNEWFHSYLMIITSYVRDEVSQGRGFKCTGGIMAPEAISLFRSFYEQGNPNGILIAS